MNERLSLQDLIDLLAKEQEITKKDAEAFLRELITIISESIEKNESVKIKDFGVFKLVKVSTRKSVDVNTGVAIEIPSHYKLSFVPDKLLKEAVNKPFAHFESVILEEGITFDNIENDEKPIVADEDELPIDEEVEEINNAPKSSLISESLNNSIIADFLNQNPVVESAPSEIEIIDTAIVGDIITDQIQEGIAITAEHIEDNLTNTSTEISIPDETSILLEEELESIVTISAPNNEPSEETIALNLSPSKDNHTVPLEIISEIEKEAASNNINKDKIVLVVTEDEDEDDEATKIPRRKLNKKLLSLAFFVFLIIAGFALGGFYFEKIAKYLTTGENPKPSTTAAMAVAEKPAISDSIDNHRAIVRDTTNISKVDSSSSKQTALTKQVQQIEETKERKATRTEVPKPKTETKPTPISNTVSSTPSSDLIVIQSGHTLRNISLKHYGHKSFWIYIYQENKGVIKNPNNVPLGTKIRIPSASKYAIDANSQESVNKAKKMESKLITEMGL